MTEFLTLLQSAAAVMPAAPAVTPEVPVAPGTVGESLTAVVPWMEQALLVGVASARFAIAFVLVPVFSNQVMPAVVRNSIIITFGLIALSLPHSFAIKDLSAGGWLWLYAKEAAAGATIGFFFGTIIWAMAAAGDIIDQKVGATIGQLLEPLGQHQDSLTATMLNRFAQVVFVSAGGLTLLVGTIMESYALWPLGPGPMRFDPAAVALFEGEFGRLFMLAFLFSAPVLAVLYVIDAGLGLLNRFAQQFNVFSLSMSIKGVAAAFVMILMLPMLAGAIVTDLSHRESIARSVMERVGKPAPAIGSGGAQP